MDVVDAVSPPSEGRDFVYVWARAGREVIFLWSNGSWHTRHNDVPARLEHADTGARGAAVWRCEVDGEELADAPHWNVALTRSFAS